MAWCRSIAVGRVSQLKFEAVITKERMESPHSHLTSRKQRGQVMAVRMAKTGNQGGEKRRDKGGTNAAENTQLCNKRKIYISN